MSPQNFIGFLTLLGFFVGVIFALLKMPSGLEAVGATIVVTLLFYMTGIVSSSMFVRYLDFKPRFTIQTNIYEKIYDRALMELRTKEHMIKDGVEFIKKLEAEEAEDYKREQIAVKAAMRKYKKMGL